MPNVAAVQLAVLGNECVLLVPTDTLAKARIGAHATGTSKAASTTTQYL